MISDKKPVQDFIGLLVTHGIRHAIITPGSRNAPFSISLLNHPDVKSYSIVDERSAGFVALGMSQQLASPVVLICTSGTAALNFAPAIAEAYYQRVPLLVVTADRPIEWIDQGEGQSIRQRNVFANYTKASYEIAEEASEGDLVWHNVRIMDEAMRLCTEGVPGPIHINFPLRESLYRTSEAVMPQVKKINRASTVLGLSSLEKETLTTSLKKADRIMVLAGQMLPDKELNAALVRFSERTGAAVFTEAHSNLSDERFITTIDRLIMGFDDAKKDFIVPDILITIGRNIISRKIKEYIRKGSTEHWHVDISGEGLDTLKHLSKIIPLSPAAFLSDLVEAGSDADAKMDYKEQLVRWNNLTSDTAARFIETVSWSDLKAFDIIHKALPSGSDLQMGNSSVVRYILLSDTRKDINYFGNRGVAGIDGCTSTAIGASFITGKLTTLISGDIGFLYDSNAFWNEMVKSHLKIIVINNAGGGIFRIIEGPRTTGAALDKFFEATHDRKADRLAAMYDLSYRSVSDAAGLVEGLQWLYSTNSCAVLEVNTPREENDKILREYFASIKTTLNN